MKRKSFLLLAFLLCFIGTAYAQGPTKPKLCATCGKMYVNCPYNGNHPKCATCGKLKEKCAYKGNHPKCATCGKVKESCPYKGSHPVCSTCGKLKENCSYNGNHPKCTTCGKAKDLCAYNGNHPKCDICGKLMEQCEYMGNHPKCATCGMLKEKCQYKGNHPSRETITVKGVTFDMILVEGGTYWMGAQSDNPSGRNYDRDAYSDEAPVHQETVSTFYMGETEVTQELWQAVMGTLPSDIASSYDLKGPKRPVCYVSWDDCQTFIKKLNSLTGRTFRLPTEAEWEYAARGGNQSKGYKYAGSYSIDDVAWYNGNSSGTHPVKQKAPNELGLYDMSGNVREWTSSYWRSNYNASENRSGRVYRGGSWYDYARDSRVSYRYYAYPVDSYGHRGLRLVLAPQ